MPFWRRAQPREADPDLRLVVGLGNPGARYERTRHNVGYMVVNELARRDGVTFKSSKQRADVARARLDGMPVLLALPTTYMNDSGQAVSRLVEYYHVSRPHLLVVCDDIDLPFGTLRLRPSGSAGGHNGLKSINAGLGTDDFARLRVGVGRPRGEAVGHVLGPFSPEEERVLPGLINLAADAAVADLRDGTHAAMNRYNRSWLAELEAQADVSERRQV